jgi:hypothetical protein
MRFLTAFGVFMSFPHLLLYLSIYTIALTLLSVATFLYFYYTIDSFYWKLIDEQQAAACTENGHAMKF